MKQVQLEDKTNTQLDEISNERRVNRKFPHTKKDIVADLVNKAHKREVKTNE